MRNYIDIDAIAATPGEFIPSLNGLRAVSVLLVLCSHYISETFFPGGLGVTVFFAISGFLITRLLLAEGKQQGRLSLCHFYLRRFLRIQPVLFANVLAVLAGYELLHLPIHWTEPAGVVLNVANYLYAPIVNGIDYGQMPFEPLWSISVEEHFYLLLPLALLLLRRRPAHILWLMAAVCLACLGWRLALALSRPALLHTWFFYMRTECRLDSLAYGAGLAALCELRSGQRLVCRAATPATLAVALCVILATLLIRNDFFRQTFRYSLQSLAIVSAFCAILFRPGLPARLLNLPLLDRIGVLSYSLYVWSVVAGILVSCLALPPALHVPLCFAAAFMLAAASYSLLERPFARLRHRLSRAPAGRAAVLQHRPEPA